MADDLILLETRYHGKDDYRPTGRELSIETAVEKESCRDYCGEDVESRAMQRSEISAAIVGRLITALHANGTLSSEAVLEVIGGNYIRKET